MAYNKHGPVHQGRKGRYVGTHWYDDIEVIPDEQRVLPETVPDHVVATHRYGCKCRPCTAYPTELKRKLRKKHLPVGTPPSR